MRVCVVLLSMVCLAAVASAHPGHGGGGGECPYMKRQKEKERQQAREEELGGATAAVMECPFAGKAKAEAAAEPKLCTRPGGDADAAAADAAKDSKCPFASMATQCPHMQKLAEAAAPAGNSCPYAAAFAKAAEGAKCPFADAAEKCPYLQKAVAACPHVQQKLAEAACPFKNPAADKGSCGAGAAPPVLDDEPAGDDMGDL
jgi:hypothetical protein